MSEAETLPRADPRPGNALKVVLASASSSRRMILANAGIAAEVEPARIDEEAVKASLRAEGAGALQVAATLAELKAQRVSAKRPAALVIGADQVLDCEGLWFDKPSDLIQAAADLRALSGKAHQLLTSVCVLRAGTCLWHHDDQAKLTMRTLDDAFIETYLEALGEAALTSVGAYHIEGLGAQLFSQIEGDYFTILGLPLLPLLDFLRNHKVVPA